MLANYSQKLNDFRDQTALCTLPKTQSVKREESEPYLMLLLLKSAYSPVQMFGMRDFDGGTKVKRDSTSEVWNRKQTYQEKEKKGTD